MLMDVSIIPWFLCFGINIKCRVKIMMTMSEYRIFWKTTNFTSTASRPIKALKSFAHTHMSPWNGKIYSTKNIWKKKYELNFPIFFVSFCNKKWLFNLFGKINNPTIKLYRFKGLFNERLWVFERGIKWGNVIRYLKHFFYIGAHQFSSRVIEIPLDECNSNN